MGIIAEIKQELDKHRDPEKAAFFPRFFQAGPGGYAEGDQFIGVTVPVQRRIAKQFYREISLEELQVLLGDPIHECRLTALLMLVNKYQRTKTETERKVLVEFYLANTVFINNWDLVDTSADKILGAYLFEKERDLLFELAQSGDLWQQRIAIIATFYFIRQGDFQDTLHLAKLLLHHEHHLIHKAVGWMLREVGNRDFQVEYDFLKEHYQEMPRTMLRYAIEKFNPVLRQDFLKGRI
ncbi:MAG: DNA alkylation repair protein [Firmicutes bacterium]|nr:DNA alkylation repair protein [Bacillota bacterium]